VSQGIIQRMSSDDTIGKLQIARELLASNPPPYPPSYPPPYPPNPGESNTTASCE
jgi:hypothetical protein